MGLLTKIEEVRKKPEAVREKIVVTTTVVIMVGLFLFWIFDLSMNVGTPSGTATSTAPSPLTIIGNNFGALITSAKDSFK